MKDVVVAYPENGGQEKTENVADDVRHQHRKNFSNVSVGRSRRDQRDAEAKHENRHDSSKYAVR